MEMSLCIRSVESVTLRDGTELIDYIAQLFF